MNRIIMQWKVVAVIGGIATLLCCGGCASIVSGTTQQVRFETSPMKADVIIDGKKVGTTPCVAIVQRSKMPPRVEIKKEGYEDANVPMVSRFNYWVIGDLLWGYCSCTAFAIDMTSHDATVEYDPNSYLTILEPVKNAEKNEPAKEQEKPKRQSKVLRYVVVNYDQLVAEIARGEGSHLSGLYELLEIPQEQQAIALAKLKDLYVKYSDTIEFGRAVEVSFPHSDKPGK